MQDRYLSLKSRGIGVQVSMFLRSQRKRDRKEQMSRLQVRRPASAAKQSCLYFKDESGPDTHRH